MSLPFVLALGFLMGMRHATDPDHVAAVSTIVARTRSMGHAAQLGAAWGIGHSVTVMAAGAVMIGFGQTLPAHVGLGLELVVGIVLVVLGARNLHAWRTKQQDPEGSDDGRARTRRRLARSLAIGVVHGLAGSAGVTLIVLASIREIGPALLYLLVFGAGTVLGMALLTVGFAVPMLVSIRSLSSVRRHIVGATGLASVAVGVFVAYEVVVDGGLFSGAPHWSPR